MDREIAVIKVEMWGWEEVAQIMYTHVSECKNDGIKFFKKGKFSYPCQINTVLLVNIKKVTKKQKPIEIYFLRSKPRTVGGDSCPDLEWSSLSQKGSGPQVMCALLNPYQKSNQNQTKAHSHPSATGRKPGLRAICEVTQKGGQQIPERLKSSWAKRGGRICLVKELKSIWISVQQTVITKCTEHVTEKLEC
jgi:hypothetical protein